MSSIHCSTEVSAPSPGFARRVANKITSRLKAWQNRRVLYHMGQMSDYELSDIGLTRADLYAVDRGPATIDPTARLGAHVTTNSEKAARTIS